ncbi:hypothetical protein [Paenibacillus piscarius]|uniref:hypothetical protein n=1 Tax=Paenibacillus piscarius TaxID=1089681 RepID=UPI001EE782BE|nr:hypothetical protein [Paenibacillus piscarius]
MNRLIFRKMALSTLLLSSIATPVFADAGNVPGQTATPAVTSTAAAVVTEQGTTLVASSFPGLLALAERYAPDTVQDWTDTLSRYNTAAGIDVKIINLDATGQVPAATASAVSVSLTSAGHNGSIAIEAAAPSMLPMFEDNEFFQAQTELLKFVESKDAAAVKQALAGLLSQYKEHAAKMEKAK